MARKNQGKKVENEMETKPIGWSDGSGDGKAVKPESRRSCWCKSKKTTDTNSITESSQSQSDRQGGKNIKQQRKVTVDRGEEDREAGFCKKLVCGLGWDPIFSVVLH